MKDLKQIEQYTSYPKYKDSGIEWLGKVPEHWKIGRLKNSIKSVSNGVWGNEPQFDENDIVCLRVADFNRDDLTINVKNLTVRNVKPNDKNKRLIEFGDLLLEKSGGGDLQPVGFVVRFTHNFPAICSNFIARIQTNELSDSNYFKYVHNTLYNLRINKRSIKQTTGIQNLDQELYFNEVVPFPPLKEQKEIADFLDHKTSQIDSIIKDKERLIECLKEYRQAIITEAVTKGLSPETTKMKDSGIEWLGEVPEQWDIKPLFAYMKKKQLKNVNNIEQNVLSLSYGKIVRRDVESNFGLLPESFETYQIVEPGNIILRLTDLQNDKRSLRVGLVKERGIITSAYLCLQITTEELNSEYAYYLLHTYDLKKVFYNLGSGVRQSLKYDELKRMPLLIPPLKEQEKIVNYLSTKTEQLDALVNDLIKQIGSLKKYKESLINEVATGKIDVRGFRKGE